LILRRNAREETARPRLLLSVPDLSEERKTPIERGVTSCQKRKYGNVSANSALVVKISPRKAGNQNIEFEVGTKDEDGKAGRTEMTKKSVEALGMQRNGDDEASIVRRPGRTKGAKKRGRTKKNIQRVERQ